MHAASLSLPNGAVELELDEAGVFSWAGTPQLAELADELVDPNEWSEDQGQPAAAAIHRLQAYLGGRAMVHIKRPGNGGDSLDRYARRKDSPGQKKFDWITIGGGPGEGGAKHEGGTPVKIDQDGKIVEGPGSLEGKDLDELDKDVAGTEDDKRKESTPPTKKKPGWVQAPAGGATSEVDGKFYKGGQWMPVHGEYSGQEKRKPKEKGGPGPDPAAEGKEKRRKPKISEATERDRAERAKAEREWREMQSSTFGSMFFMGDHPHAMKRADPGTKNWVNTMQHWSDDSLQRLAEESKKVAIENLRSQGKIKDDQDEKDYVETQELFVEDQREFMEGQRFGKSHLKTHPSSPAALTWFSEAHEAVGNPYPAHQLLEGVKAGTIQKEREELAAGDTATDDEQAKYDEYAQQLQKAGITPRKQDEWLKTYRKSQEAAVTDHKRGQEEIDETQPGTLQTEDEIRTGIEAGALDPEEAAEELQKQRNLIPGLTEKQKQAVADWGEKIGGARKETASKRGPRGATKKDDRPGWARRYDVSQVSKSTRPGEEGKFALYDTRQKTWTGQPKQIGLFDTEEEARASIAIAEVSRNHRISRDGDEYTIVRQVGPRKRPVVKGGFKSRDDAARYMAENPESLIEHKFPRYEEAQYLDDVRRTGPDIRGGKKITPEQLQQAFPFRGGEFGNWVSQQEGQESLNHAYEALHDLAEITGMSPSELTMGGDLAVAFGARGTGGQHSARAHYEPDKRVINLTKMKGAGTLAHEWSHSLDWHLGEGSALTGKRRDTSPVGQAMQAVKDAIMSVDVQQTKAVDDQKRRLGAASKSVSNDLASLEEDFKPTEWRKVKPWKTPEDEARWNELKEKIASGDVGKSYMVPGKSRWGGRWSFPELEEANKLYKSRTGRSFYTNSDNSPGRSLYWSIRRLTETSKHLEDAQSGTTTAKQASNFLQEAHKLDNTRTGSYYTLPHELFARAFEGWAQDKLSGQQRQSDYLVARADNRHYVPLGMKPYPEGDERERINAAFDKFFDVLKSAKS